jgi:hypothetical protein
MKREIYFDTLGMKVEETAHRAALQSADDVLRAHGGLHGGALGDEAEASRAEVASRGKDLILRLTRPRPADAATTDAVNTDGDGAISSPTAATEVTKRAHG